MLQFGRSLLAPEWRTSSTFATGSDEGVASAMDPGHCLTISLDDRSSLSRGADVRWLILDEVPEHVWPAWVAILDDEERARASRFVREADRRQFVAAHTLLRVMLSSVLGGRPRHWRFVSGPHGKPTLHPDDGQPGLEFNISHTFGAVACGVAKGCTIGVDIEDQERSGDHLAIAEAYFAPSELLRLRQASVAERPALFCLLWTLKEAYIKAVGGGLSMPLDQFAISLDPIAITFSEPADDNAIHWRFESIACTRRHRLAVALRSEDPIPLRCTQASWHEMTRFIASSEPVETLPDARTTTNRVS